MKELADVKIAYQELINDSNDRIDRLQRANAQMVAILFDVYWEYKKTERLTPEIMDKIQKGLKVVAFKEIYKW